MRKRERVRERDRQTETERHTERDRERISILKKRWVFNRSITPTEASATRKLQPSCRQNSNIWGLNSLELTIKRLASATLSQLAFPNGRRLPWENPKNGTVKCIFKNPTKKKHNMRCKKITKA